MNFTKAILVSNNAKCLPMHALGPPPNPIKSLISD